MIAGQTIDPKVRRGHPKILMFYPKFSFKSEESHCSVVVHLFYLAVLLLQAEKDKMPPEKRTLVLTHFPRFLSDLEEEIYSAGTLVQSVVLMRVSCEIAGRSLFRIAEVIII